MALASQGLKTAIWNNNLRSLLLLGLYPVLLAGIGWLAAALYFGFFQTGLRGGPAPATAANAFIAAYWPMIAGVVFVWFALSWFFHTRMVRTLSGSRPVSRREEPALYNLLENLSIAAGMPMPRLEIVETGARNAFASGIDDRSYTVTVTRGLMQSLQKDELEAVLAHELTHIRNRDVRLLIVSVIFAGMFGFAAQMTWNVLRNMLYRGTYDNRRQGGSRSGSGSAQLALFIGLLAGLLWVGYLATLLTRFALSRRREFMADAGAVELTRRPESMMRALMRIASHNRIPVATDDIALMCTVNTVPFLGLFATHPPIETRIAALAALSGVPVPGKPTLPPANPLERLEEQRKTPPNPWRRPTPL